MRRRSQKYWCHSWIPHTNQIRLGLFARSLSVQMKALHTGQETLDSNFYSGEKPYKLPFPLLCTLGKQPYSGVLFILVRNLINLALHTGKSGLFILGRNRINGDFSYWWEPLKLGKKPFILRNLINWTFPYLKETCHFMLELKKKSDCPLITHFYFIGGCGAVFNIQPGSLPYLFL